MKKTVLIGAMLLGFILIANMVFGDFYVIPTRPRIAGTEITSLPYTISSSGFYFIARDLTSIDNGIVVEADNVTIDLMGFSLIGPGKTSGTGFGIYMNGRTNVEVRNGTVRDFGDNGIFAQGSNMNHRIINVKANGNGSYGIYLTGTNHLVKNCTVYNNGYVGIYAQYGSTITGNKAYQNADFGVFCQDGCTVTGNTTYGNQNHGISVGTGSTVTGNTAYENTNDGIHTDDGCTVAGNTVYNNQNNGIYLNSNCLIHGNTAVNNNQSGGAYTDISCSQGNCSDVDNHVTTPTS